MLYALAFLLWYHQSGGVRPAHRHCWSSGSFLVHSRVDQIALEPRRSAGWGRISLACVIFFMHILMCAYVYVCICICLPYVCFYICIKVCMYTFFFSACFNVNICFIVLFLSSCFLPWPPRLARGGVLVLLSSSCLGVTPSERFHFMLARSYWDDAPSGKRVCVTVIHCLAAAWRMIL